ncbi:hypothetical protein FRC0326_00078 [Corynebacterium diphtheriae]|nr:hypothetical protein FRC0326_00078 [Corynebacterium diphtheriae]
MLVTVTCDPCEHLTKEVFGLGTVVGDTDVPPRSPCVEVLARDTDSPLSQFVDNALCRLSPFWSTSEIKEGWASPYQSFCLPCPLREVLQEEVGIWVLCHIVGAEGYPFAGVVRYVRVDTEGGFPVGEFLDDVSVEADCGEVARGWQSTPTGAVSGIEGLYPHVGFECINLNEKELKMPCLHADVVFLVHLPVDPNPSPPRVVAGDLVSRSRTVSVGCFL